MNKNWLYLVLALFFLLIGAILTRIAFFLGTNFEKPATFQSFKIGNTLIQFVRVEMQLPWWTSIGIAFLVVGAVLFFVQLFLLRRRLK